MKEVRLTVANARQKDSGKGIARIGGDFMKRIGVVSRDFVEIVGNKRTAVIVRKGYKADKGKSIVRIDAFTRTNAGLVLNRRALVRRADVKEARKMVIAPIDMRLNVDSDFINFVKNLRLIGRAFYEGDKIAVLMLGHTISFDVIRTKPHAVPVNCTEATELNILNEPHPPPEEKPTLDIKYLLRFDWLNNLATRMQASRIVFSIPDHMVSNTEEQKVIESARRIADEDLSHISVEVTFESNGAIIGTLPWAEVNIYGRVTAAYPDIDLPPTPISLIPQRPYGRAIAPMKRCFKTGVKSCPKKINFSPRSVVVAMPFEDEFEDTYKYAIRPVLEEADFKPWKADEQISNIDIMCKICHAIQESGYLLANITTWNANVVFELGLAYGLARSVILIKRKKAEVPVDLRGLECIEYSTIDELKGNLLLFLKGAATTE